MEKIHVSPEIQYVQKLFFFLFLATFSLAAGALVFWLWGITCALFVLGFGLIVSYIAMLKKKNFASPGKKITARRMAHEIAQTTDPIVISRFASQLYCYLHEPQLAVALLEKFLPSQDPLLCTTLSEILFKEGRPRRALAILKNNPAAFANPLLLAAQGHILKDLGEISEALALYQKSLYCARQNGLPSNGAPWLTQKFFKLSHLAHLHHALADCHYLLNDLPSAKQEYRSGNLLLFDFSLWRHCPDISTISSVPRRKNRKAAH